ncbi:MAG: NUDIX hydrolase [Propionibacteriaceae bacterium]|nr:NUDIX hydrolase [Propionibacteriaceae bacterium]
MSRKPSVIAAGGVVLRTHHNKGEQVLLIHRESYDDWSLPKGKGLSDELLPETAIREIREETGVTARLDLRLPTQRYTVAKGLKATHYWRAGVVEQRPRKPDLEVQRVKWFTLAEAMALLTYETDREVVQAAMDMPATNVLMLVRHGKAMLRKDWTGPDQRRRLAGRGRKQSQRLMDLLDAFGIERLVSSSATRCFQTLEPYAESRRLPIRKVDILTEEEGTKHPKRVARFMTELKGGLDRPTAVCGHRPVLPAMYLGLGVDEKPMVVAEAVALHLDATGALIRSEVFKPTA